MLEEVLESGEKALVFTQFKEMGDRLQVHLKDVLGFEPPFLHGGSTREQRDEMVRSFQEDADGARVLLLSLKAGGVGLNLTAATHVFHFDRWWNPAVEDQATDRTYRIGQTRNVQVHKLITMGTLEEKIDAMLESKRDLADRVVGTGEGWLTELDDDALRRLVAAGARRRHHGRGRAQRQRQRQRQWQWPRRTATPARAPPRPPGRSRPSPGRARRARGPGGRRGGATLAGAQAAGEAGGGRARPRPSEARRRGPKPKAGPARKGVIS